MDKIEIELQIASAILQEPALLSGLAVSIDEFSSWEAIHCINAVEKMEKEGVKVTRAEVSRYVDSMERSRVATIWNAAQTRANFKHHVMALSDIVKSEKLHNLSMIIEDSRQTDKPDTTIQRIEEYLHTINQLSKTYEPIKIGEALRASVERLEERMKAPGLPGVTTGYHDLNRHFGGFEKNKLYYVGARPSQGKTALMLNFALHVLETDTPVGIISVESTEREIADRIMAISGCVDSLDMRNGAIKPSDTDKLTNAVRRLYDKPGLIYHNPHSTVSDVVLQARRMVKNHDVKVIFVDYIQLIDAGSARMREPRHQQVAYISRELKAMAPDLGVAVVALAQINRASDGRSPLMGDFAESSSLEKDADVMMAIHHEDREAGEYSAIKILKARDGLTGECPVRFIREYLRFVEE